jgi:GTP cyclohydrolase-4
MTQVETQERRPDVEVKLDRVGVINLRTIALTDWKGTKYNFVPKMEVVVDLEGSRKGIHMSRLVESIIESLSKEVSFRHHSMEEIERHVLYQLGQRHRFKRAEVWMETQLVVMRKTPQSKEESFETHDVRVGVLQLGEEFRKELSVTVLGNTLCPHAMENNEGRTHIQRAKGTLTIETDYDNPLNLEDMIECVEEAFSSEVYTLLKTEDESFIINRMHERPRFVEDVCREMLRAARDRFSGCQIKARAVSEESIHRHDVVAEGSCKT